MSETSDRPRGQHPGHGSIGYLQLPARDLAESLAFYREVFGWSGDLAYGSFEAPGLIGQWTLEREPTPMPGPCYGSWPTDYGRPSIGLPAMAGPYAAGPSSTRASAG